jgi:hypothetical protein
MLFSDKRRLLIVASFLVSIAALAGCGANHHSIYRYQPLKKYVPAIVSLDAKQRVILVGGANQQSNHSSAAADEGSRMFCAEPSPDVFSVLAQSFSGKASGGTGSGGTVSADLGVAFSQAEQGGTIARTQTLNLIREIMYRTCERYLNHGIGAPELSIQAIRDSHDIVDLLAIEQLTGVTWPPVVQLSAKGDAAPPPQGGSPDPPPPAPNPTPAPGGDPGAAPAPKDAAAKDPAAKDPAPTGGAGAVSTTTTSSVTSGTGPALDKASITTVADTILQIVKLAHSDDEFLLFCIKSFSSPSLSAVTATCTDYVNKSIELAQAKKTQEIAEIEDKLHVTFVGQLDPVWKMLSGSSRVGFIAALRSFEPKAGPDSRALEALMAAPSEAAALAAYEHLGDFYKQRVRDAAAQFGGK